MNKVFLVALCVQKFKTKSRSAMDRLKKQDLMERLAQWVCLPPSLMVIELLRACHHQRHKAGIADIR